MIIYSMKQHCGLTDAGATTSAQMQAAQLGSMLKGHHMTLNQWSPHMRESTTTTFLLHGTAVMSVLVALVQHLPQLLKLMSIGLSHPKSTRAWEGLKDPHHLVHLVCLEGRSWESHLVFHLEWASQAWLIWQWLDWVPAKGSCLFMHIWDSSTKWMRLGLWCQKGNQRKSPWQSLVWTSPIGHRFITKSWIGCLLDLICKMSTSRKFCICIWWKFHWWCFSLSSFHASSLLLLVVSWVTIPFNSYYQERAFILHYCLVLTRNDLVEYVIW